MALRGVPRIPVRTLARPRLRALLESPVAIVTLHAPSGYGKTIAVAEWAVATGAEGLWLRVRGHEVDAEAFVHDLAEELLASGFARGDGPLRHLREATMAGTDPWDVLRRALRDTGELVLVVDDADRLSDSAVEGLVGLVEELPGLRVRATARRRLLLTEPSLPLTIDAETIGTDQLALTRDEAAELLGPQATDARLDDVLAAGGSPLVARALAATGDDDEHAGDAAAVFASLLNRRIAGEQWDARLVEFLLRTAVADELTVDLAATLSGDGEAERMLARAELEGLGLWSSSPSRGERFRYAPPVREGLERILRARQPREVRGLALATARWEATDRSFFRALERAREYEDWALATAIVREGWHVLLSNHGKQVRALFNSVPLLTMRKLPLVAMMLALIYNARGSNRLRALEFFALASYGASRQAARADPADRALLAGLQAAALRVAGRIQPALAAADRCYDTLTSMSPADRDRLGPNEPTLYNQAGTTFFYGGRTELALDSFARSTAVGDARGLTAGILALGMTAGVQAVAGDLPEAEATVAEAAERDWPEGWLTGYSGSFLQIARAFIALEAFDLDEADRRVRILDPHRATIEHWALLTHLDVLIELLRGRPGEALLRLRSTERHQSRRSGHTSFTADRLRHTVVLAHLANGDALAAERALGSKTADARSAVSLARIALARGLPDDALRVLRSWPASEAGVSNRVRAESLLLTTAALALSGDDEQTAAAAAAALAFADDRHQRLAIALVPEPALAAVVASLERSGAETAAASIRSVLDRAFIPGGLISVRLTPRETEVARRLPTHVTMAEIAADLSVSANTVKTQLRSLYRKLGVSSRQEALVRLTVLGITDASTSAPDPASAATPGAAAQTVRGSD